MQPAPTTSTLQLSVAQSVGHKEHMLTPVEPSTAVGKYVAEHTVQEPPTTDYEPVTQFILNKVAHVLTLPAPRAVG